MSIEFLRPTWIDVRYFGSDRFFPNDSYKEFIGGKIDCKELVTFDCCLMNLYELESAAAPLHPDTKQIVAVIFRPDIDPLDRLEREGFEFCGYDLVEESTGIIIQRAQHVDESVEFILNWGKHLYDSSVGFRLYHCPTEIKYSKLIEVEQWFFLSHLIAFRLA